LYYIILYYIILYYIILYYIILYYIILYYIILYYIILYYILSSFTFAPLPISYVPFSAIHYVSFIIAHFLACYLPFFRLLFRFSPSFDSWEASKQSTYKHKVSGSEWIQLAYDTVYWRTIVQRVIASQAVQRAGRCVRRLAGRLEASEGRRSISRAHPLHKPLNTTGTHSRIFKHICFTKTGDLELIKNRCVIHVAMVTSDAHFRTKLCGEGEPADI